MTPEERAERKIAIANAQKIKAMMTVEEKIRFLNTPYNEMPDELKPGMTKHPQQFKFVRLTKRNLGCQKETFAARLIRYRHKFNLQPEDFCAIANEYGKDSGIRITLRDINNYENFNICPKIDKMTLIAKAMGVGIDYFAGYGTANRRSKNMLIESRKTA